MGILKFIRYGGISFCVLCAFSAQAQEDNLRARKLLIEGNELYQKGNYTAAQQKFNEALQADYNYVNSTYNLGNALYRQQKYEEAGAAYESYAGQINDRTDRAMAYHNLGNAYLQAKEYAKSVEAFKKALKNNPADEDTRYNLAYAQKKLQEQEKQQNQDQDQSGKNQDNKEQDKDKEKPQDQNQGDQDKKDKNQGKQEKPQPNRLSKEQAKQLLDALNQNEKEIQDKLNKEKNKATVRGIEKDW